MLLPPPDRILVSFKGLPHGPLRREAKLPQKPPDMAWVELHAELLLDHLAHPPTRPESRRKPKPLRSRLHYGLHPRELYTRESRLAARAPRLAKTPTPGLLQSLRPPVHRLSVRTYLPGDLGLAQALPQKRRRLQPALLQRIKVPPDSCWIAHAPQRSRKYGKCHYI